MQWVRSIGLVVGLGVSLPGCCALFCRVPAPEGAPRLHRDFPDEAVDFTVDAFRNRRIRDIYASLHPEFRERYGSFSLGDFTAAFREYEDLFRQDAERFAKSDRSAVQYSRDGKFAGILLIEGDMSAELVFKNRPIANVRLDDEFVPESSAPIGSLAEVIQIEDGYLFPRVPVAFDGLRGASPTSLARLEYHNDWLIWDIRNPRNVKFLERIEEHF